MDIQERISRQRVQHIIDSYQLDGDDGDVFTDYMDQLLETYAYPLIELALTEAIIKGWSEIPMKKGLRSEEHTSELQSLTNLVCRLLLEKKKQKNLLPNYFLQ